MNRAFRRQAKHTKGGPASLAEIDANIAEMERKLAEAEVMIVTLRQAVTSAPRGIRPPAHGLTAWSG
jgi:hypothetical protein